MVLRAFKLSICVLFALPAVLVGQTLQLADSLISIGQSYKERGNYPQAEFYYGQALEIYQKQQDSTQWRGTAIDYSEILIDRAK
ncbi:MAG: tetratricopeptide repeat protein, partial [Balneolaceae bacterium]|nr:tetratricopeptide repeat protein [Balneolaceae bacterium]